MSPDRICPCCEKSMDHITIERKVIWECYNCDHREDDMGVWLE